MKKHPVTVPTLMGLFVSYVCLGFVISWFIWGRPTIAPSNTYHLHPGCQVVGPYKICYTPETIPNQVN